MAQHSHHEPVVLEYKKRRFDGGTERELIAQIEYQQQVYEQQMMAHYGHLPYAHHQQQTATATSTLPHPQQGYAHSGGMAPSCPMPAIPIGGMGQSMTSDYAEQSREYVGVETQVKTNSYSFDQAMAVSQQKNSLCRIFFIPIFELVLGITGVIIGMMMCFKVFRSVSSVTDMISRDRHVLMERSWVIIKNSISNLFTSPFRAVQHLMGQAAVAM